MAFEPSKIDYANLAPEETRLLSNIQQICPATKPNHLIDTITFIANHVSEIGCGRGDFLALLCELGDNYGVELTPLS